MYYKGALCDNRHNRTETKLPDLFHCDHCRLIDSAFPPHLYEGYLTSSEEPLRVPHCCVNQSSTGFPCCKLTLLQGSGHDQVGDTPVWLSGQVGRSLSSLCELISDQPDIYVYNTEGSGSSLGDYSSDIYLEDSGGQDECYHNKLSAMIWNLKMNSLQVSPLMGSLTDYLG